MDDAARADGLRGLFEDLEQQAEALELAERDAEVADRAHAEYRDVRLAERLQASVGSSLRVELAGCGTVRGRLERAGADCLVLAVDDAAGRSTSWVLSLAHVGEVVGAADAAVAPDAWPMLARLGWQAALRRLAQDQQSCVLVRADGRTSPGRVLRVGADFVEHLPDGSPTPVLTPMAALAAVRG